MSAFELVPDDTDIERCTQYHAVYRLLKAVRGVQADMDTVDGRVGWLKRVELSSAFTGVRVSFHIPDDEVPYAG